MARMRLNLALGIINGVYAAGVGFLVVPFYLSYLGLEAYGLIGFYVALQGVLGLFDLGLTPTMSREVARARGQGDVVAPRNLLFTFALISWVIAAVIGIGVVALSGWFTHSWLQTQTLPDTTVQQAVMLMGIAVAVRWPLAIYSGVLIGAERLALISIINIVMISITSLGAVAILAFVAPTLKAFFVWQALAGGVHVLVARAASWRALYHTAPARFHREGLMRVWRFSAGTAVITVLSVIFVQSDKVVLSRLVGLEALGQYTLAFLVARVLNLVVGPTFNVVYPRLTHLTSTGDRAELLRFYKSVTWLLMMVVWSGAVYLLFFGVDLVTLWTGDAALAQRIALCVALLAMGTALNTAMTLPYALQLASGMVRIPLTITVTLIIVFVPMLAGLSRMYGINGAAGSWLILNFLYLPFGTWLTHRTLLRGEGVRWIIKDVLLPAFMAAAIVGGGAVLTRFMFAGAFAHVAAGLLFPALTVGFALLWSRDLIHHRGRGSVPAVAAA